ncbi:MAG: hypothetical protein M1269_00515 [Chloroflexi bacterium]|nr:hypothetical protein [Chloroflexota bacterium]
MLYYNLILPVTAGIGYLIIALLINRPALGNFSSAYIGEGELQGWLWRYWWMKQVLSSAWHDSGSINFWLYVLFSVSHLPEAGNMFDLTFISWPLEWLFGPASGYNLKIILVLAANGVCGYLLFRYLSKNEFASFLAGTFFAFNPYVLSEISTGRVRQALVFSIPVFVLYFLKMLKDDRLGITLAAGLSLGITAVIYWYYGMFLLFWVVIYLIYILFTTERHLLNLNYGKRLLICALFALVVSLPFTTPYLKLALARNPLPEVTWLESFPSLSEAEGKIGHAGISALKRSFRRFLDDSPSADYLFRTVPRYSIHFLVTLLALIPFYLRQKKRPPMWIFWLAAFLFFYVLSLGPYLKIGYMGQPVRLAGGQGIALPYILFFKYVPIFSRLFSPCRIISMVGLCMGVLLSYNLSYLFGILKGRARIIVSLIIGALFLGIFFGYMAVTHRTPLPVTRLEIPQFYTDLANESGAGVVEIPLGMGDMGNFYQIFHNQRVLRGWAEIPLPGNFPKGNAKHLSTLPVLITPDNKFIELLESIDPGRDPKTVKDVQVPPEDISAVYKSGYKYLVLHELEYVRADSKKGFGRFKSAKEKIEKLLGASIKSEQEPGGGYKRMEMLVFRLRGRE